MTMQPITIKDIKKARYERKFLISELDKHEVEATIKSNPAMFSEIFHERPVNNIYLDSADLASYHDNVMGKDFRMKTRIRWYGDAFGMIKKPMLEIKIKNSELGSKRLFPLNPFIFDRNFSREFLISEVISKSNLPAWVIDHVKSLKFALLNRYRRKYFESRDKNYRISLDFEFEFYAIGQQKNTFIGKIMQNDYVILELKYEREKDLGAQKITNSFPFRLTKSSKYVSGIENLHGTSY